MAKISLQQFLMKTGRFRTVHDALRAIKQGDITISGREITTPRYFIDGKNALVFYRGQPLKTVRSRYFLFNKPIGLICQKSRDEPSVYGALHSLPISADERQSLFCAGRLDKDTEGLLLLTNDGALTHKLNDPDSKVEKTYEVTLTHPLQPGDKAKLEQGIDLWIDGGPWKTQPCKISPLSKLQLKITITEGKKRQIRDMFASLDNEVLFLKRISIGGLSLGKIPIEQFKEITREEAHAAIISTPKQ